MLNVGLTGNIASGKSAVAQQLVLLGAFVIDADMLAREAVEPGTEALRTIQRHFGDGVLTKDGALDREALRRIVFHDAAARDALNAIVHPAVSALRQMEFDAAGARGVEVIVSDIPLLFETGQQHDFDAVILVDAPEPVRLARLIAHRALPEVDALAMMSAQHTATSKRAGATFVIENDDTLEELTKRVREVWRELLKLSSTNASSTKF